MKQISTLNGKLPIRYGWGTLSTFADITGKAIDELIYAFKPDRLRPRQLSEFIFQGIKDGCKEEGIECPFKSYEDVEKLIDSVGLKQVVKETLAAFQASPFIMSDAKEEDEDKKK